MKHTRLPLIAALLACVANSSFAQATREDYDLDNDGLIEINSLADLDLIRHSPTGASLNGQSAGCPDDGCVGFELTADIDFDTNRDGRFGPGDSHWNKGYGWVPIQTFSGRFNGNDFVIRNLYVHQSQTYFAPGVHAGTGLFAHTDGAVIENLGLITARQPHGVAEPAAIFGTGDAGALIGSAVNTHLRAIWAQVTVTGGIAGGLVGAGSITAQAIHLSGQVDSLERYNTSKRYGCAGGLIGEASALTASQLVMQVERRSRECNQVVAGNLSATDNAISQLLVIGDSSASSDRATLSSAAGADSPYFWNLGSAVQVPALVVNGRLWRDSDGDGHFDDRDAFPTNPAAVTDTDQDGAIDAWALGCDSACQASSQLVLDQFPFNPAASLDLDLDGFPDAWNSGCDDTCQQASGLTLDAYPNDADNAGVSAADLPQAIRDSHADRDGNGLIEVGSLEELDRIRLSLAGFGRVAGSGQPLDVSGCPTRIVGGTLTRACRGFELTRSISFTEPAAILWADGSYYHLPVWRPLATAERPFRAEFNGNGHTLSDNFTYIREAIEFGGLFGALRDASVVNLRIKDAHSISLNNGAGLLASLADHSVLRNVAASGSMEGNNWGGTGLLIGSIHGVRIDGAVVKGQIAASAFHFYNGGLVGHASDSAISRVLVDASVYGDASAGLVGWRRDTSLTQALVLTPGGHLPIPYWPITGSYVGKNADTGVYSLHNDAWKGRADGFTLTELQCPLAPNDRACAKRPLYENFDTAASATDNTYWVFGSGQQLPGLSLNGLKFFDSDADGVFDIDDAFPDDKAASLDSDGDGAPDRWNEHCDSLCQSNSHLRLDDFPFHAAASLDANKDGVPDTWNLGCDIECQKNSGLWGQWNAAPPLITQVPPKMQVSADSSGYADVSLKRNLVITQDHPASGGQLTLKVNGEVLGVDNSIRLPTGRHEIRWTAEAPSGLVSAPVIQIVEVYPRVGFSESAVVTGYPSLAQLPLSIAGAMPKYPVTITLAFAGEPGSVPEGLLDLSPEALTFTIPDAAAAKDFTLDIPVNHIEQSLGEIGVQFVIEKARAGEDEPFTLATLEEQDEIMLTVTERNLAPSVSLHLFQRGVPVSRVSKTAGDFELVAEIIDPNGNDSHEVMWSLGALTHQGVGATTWAVDPTVLHPQDYTVTVSVADSGSPTLVATAEWVVTVFDPLAASSSSSPRSSVSSSRVSSTASSHSLSSSQVIIDTGGSSSSAVSAPTSASVGAVSSASGGIAPDTDLSSSNYVSASAVNSSAANLWSSSAAVSASSAPVSSAAASSKKSGGGGGVFGLTLLIALMILAGARRRLTD